jgi:hypothetical protein
MRKEKGKLLGEFKAGFEKSLGSGSNWWMYSVGFGMGRSGAR